MLETSWLSRYHKNPIIPCEKDNEQQTNSSMVTLIKFDKKNYEVGVIDLKKYPCIKKISCLGDSV